jgi:hypothetical protein
VLPVTALYAAALAALFLALTWRVIRRRRGLGIDMGSGGDRLTERFVRAHGNFAEHVPLALLLMAVAEANGAPAPLLHGVGAALLAGRLAHAWSFSVAGLRLGSRTAGVTLTLTVLAVLAGLLLAQALGLA